jgi:hypothetical protein
VQFTAVSQLAYNRSLWKTFIAWGIHLKPVISIFVSTAFQFSFSFYWLMETFCSFMQISSKWIIIDFSEKFQAVKKFVFPSALFEKEIQTWFDKNENQVCSTRRIDWVEWTVVNDFVTEREETPNRIWQGKWPNKVLLYQEIALLKWIRKGEQRLDADTSLLLRVFIVGTWTICWRARAVANQT